MDAGTGRGSAGQCDRQLLARLAPVQQSEVLPHAQSCADVKNTLLFLPPSLDKLRSCQDEKAVRSGQVGAGCLI